MERSKTSVFSGTFSILTISPDFRLMGVAVASGSTHVGDRVPHAKPGIGVIATQAYTNINYGIKGLKLMEKGLTPKKALKTLLTEDPERNVRQVAIMDFKGKKTTFTGANAPEYHAEAIGKNYIVIGNLLSSKDVVYHMAKHFESSSGDLAWKMAWALKAGSESGGDKRGEKSAALITVGIEKVEVKIKVAAHKNSIEELFRRLKLHS